MSFAKLPMLLAPVAMVFMTSSFPPGSAHANEYEDDHYNCKQLWHARNSIYADKGYCFKTKRAKKAFPDSCFPPYGKLTQSEKREISLIKKGERYKRC